MPWREHKLLRTIGTLAMIRAAVVATLYIEVLLMIDYYAIPSDMLVWVIVFIAVAAVLATYVQYIVSWNKQKSDILQLKALAKAEGKEVDELELAKVKKFSVIYACAALITPIVSAGFIYAALCALPAYAGEMSLIDYCIVGFFGELIIQAFLDKYVIHAIADGTFQSKVLDPVLEKFLGIGKTAVKGLKDMSVEDLQRLIDEKKKSA